MLIFTSLEEGHAQRVSEVKDVPLGSGGAAVPNLTRTTSRQCIACDHRAKLLPEIPEPVSAPPVLIPTPVPEEPVFVRQTRETGTVMTAKPENVREVLEDRDPNSLNQHVQQIWCTAPCLRCVKIYFASLRTMVQSCMAAIVVPAADAVGHICRHIRVNFRKDAPEEKDLLIV
ncbi:unnamed protein product [Spodoptera littoralis]|uniref:Uncharacterized protein n=1 Tax=Spodoptera littoralis TaxID=7109 RepID=A0A9P0I1D1_SPOLI|nr:unnamed protein product [Spodoptera littoralis]CAH1639415.1 unnamed protein product [Spodoptera littoralis]